MLVYAMSRERGQISSTIACLVPGKSLRQRYQANDIIELVSRGDMATVHPTSSSSDIAR
jgi:hypothetical protein